MTALTKEEMSVIINCLGHQVHSIEQASRMYSKDKIPEGMKKQMKDSQDKEILAIKKLINKLKQSTAIILKPDVAEINTVS